MSQRFNGTDLNGDGELDFGSCFPAAGEYSEFYFLTWLAPFLQYRDTSQGAVFDAQTLEPLFDNPAAQEALRLWKEVAGPSYTGESPDYYQLITWWMEGRCALAIGPSLLYTMYQSSEHNSRTGISIAPGSQRVWWREGQQVVQCNRSFCRHATVYEDGLFVNHAPSGQSSLDGAINGQADSERQLAAYTFFTWLINDANFLDSTVHPATWPNLVASSPMRPSLMVPSVWSPYGWGDPALSMLCATMTTHLEHPNVFPGIRLLNSAEYLHVTQDILSAFWYATGEYEGLDDEASSKVASERLSSAWEQVTSLRDRTTLIVSYQKSLNIYVVPSNSTSLVSVKVLPTWFLPVVIGISGGTAGIAFFGCFCWLTAIIRHRRRLYAKQLRLWSSIVDDAEAYTASLAFPMAVVGVSNFLQLGCLVPFETLRNDGKLRFLDTFQKIRDLQQNGAVIFVSHLWLGWSTPDPDGVHFEAVCAAVLEACRMVTLATDRLDRVFIWIDFCSIPQDHVATRELAVSSVPLYAAVSDVFIAVAPPATHSELHLEVGMSAHLRGGWCRAELLARVVGAGVRNLFFCESVLGELQVITWERLEAMDLRVFSGEFRCCALDHSGGLQCDLEGLRTPILGVYAQCLRTLEDLSVETTPHSLALQRFKNNKEGMLPRHVEKATGSGTVAECELFGPLSDMLEARFEAARRGLRVASPCAMPQAPLANVTEHHTAESSDGGLGSPVEGEEEHHTAESSDDGLGLVGFSVEGGDFVRYVLL